MRHAYNHRVTFQHLTQTQDPVTGALSDAWADFKANVPAEVLTGPGREVMAADAKWSETAARVSCPWFPGLTTAMRMTWDSKTFDVTSIETDASARREYRLRVAAGVNSGA